MQDTSLWAKAIEQLPALALSLGAFLFLLVKGMAFIRNLTTTFMRHQEERDKLMHEQLLVIGADCHDWAERRQEAMASELRASRAALESFTVAQAKNQVVMERVAIALGHAS